MRTKQLETDDPLVENIAIEGNLDVEYLAIMNQIKNKTETIYINEDSEMIWRF